MGLAWVFLRMSGFGANSIPNQPRLRLVFPDRGPSIDEARVRRQIAEENARAAESQRSMADADVRRILAQRVQESLEGGRAALLPVQRRRELIAAGQKLGLRPFESNLIVAIVQDGARRGTVVTDKDTQRALGMIPAPEKGARGSREFWMWARILLATGALAGLMLTMLIEWITKG